MASLVLIKKRPTRFTRREKAFLLFLLYLLAIVLLFMLIDLIILLLESKLSSTDQFVLKVIFAYLFVLSFLLVNHFNEMVRAYQIITHILVINKY
jgi:hypothetical protein